ncbi:MAG TPA: FAD-dependent oxidoreductase [bacterium]|nr:FAD-dependent oxidoreductase [bacterium]
MTAQPKPRLLVLGTGFASFSLLKKLNFDYYDVTVVSPQNYLLFTPLLAGTTVGTLEFRNIVEPLRRSFPRVRYYQAAAKDLNPAQKTVTCQDSLDGSSFELSYDLLVVALGAKVNTFGIEGVTENALFLKSIEDAQRIRRRVLECFERASRPDATPEKRRQLLNFVVMGGGPTGAEFAAELHDLVHREMKAYYEPLMGEVRVTIIDVAEFILGAFDKSLRDYATRHFTQNGIQVKTGSSAVKIEKETIFFKDGTQMPYGLLVWATGIAPTPALQAFPLPKDRGSRVLVDDHLRVQDHPGLYALGDCAAVNGMPLPATAQVAMQQGDYLGGQLNGLVESRDSLPFHYHHLGIMCYVGDDIAIADLPALKWHGHSAHLFWRLAYLMRLMTLKNKFLVFFGWVKTACFGRDISRI